MFDPISGLLTAGSAMLNFFGGKSAQDKALEAQAAANAQNRADAYHFANNSVAMRVADANRAGIHPAFALGAPAMSAPVQVVGAAGVPNNTAAPLARGMADLGQNLSRAALAPVSGESKIAAVTQAQQVASNAIDIDTKKMQYEILKARYAQMVGTPPVGPFVTPETHKIEERPPLSALGNRWETSSDTSNAESFEKRYGDDGPASWLINTGILARDIAHNVASKGGFQWFGAGSGRSALDRLEAENKWRRLSRDKNFTMGY